MVGAPLAFPLRTPYRLSRGPHLRPNLGVALRPVNGALSTPVDNVVDEMWNAPNGLWTARCGTVHNPVGDTPGWRGGSALTSHNGAMAAVDERKFAR